jgi:hypothetical protein
MPYPYDNVIRHAWSPGDVPCDACYTQILNRACGKEWCACTCMEDPSAQADLAPGPETAPEFTTPTEEMEDFMPIDYPVEKVEEDLSRVSTTRPGPPTWKETELPRRDTRDTARISGAFWIGVIMTTFIALLATSDINPWTRGILIALVAIFGMASAGSLMKGK